MMAASNRSCHSLVFQPTQVHKGLENNSGENNCFLNVVIQALWHLGEPNSIIIVRIDHEAY